MSKNLPQKLRLGFIAAIDVDGRGHIGGLLVTNHNGRPLEFQCTTPVKPDRNQEILYGRMLRPWLLGELIGKTLLDRASIKPELIVVDDDDLLELRNHTETPVASTLKSQASKAADLEGRHLKFHDDHSSDSEFISEKLHLLPGQADLEEPLQRVHEALNETVRTVMAR